MEEVHNANYKLLLEAENSSQFTVSKEMVTSDINHKKLSSSNNPNKK